MPNLCNLCQFYAQYSQYAKRNAQYVKRKCTKYAQNAKIICKIMDPKQNMQINMQNMQNNMQNKKPKMQKIFKNMQILQT